MHHDQLMARVAVARGSHRDPTFNDCSSCLAKPTRSHWPGGAGVGVVTGRELLRDGLRCGKK